MLCYVYFVLRLFRFLNSAFTALYFYLHCATTTQLCCRLPQLLSRRRCRRCRFLLFYYSVARSHERVFRVFHFTLLLYYTTLCYVKVTLRYFSCLSDACYLWFRFLVFLVFYFDSTQLFIVLLSYICFYCCRSTFVFIIFHCLFMGGVENFN